MSITLHLAIEKVLIEEGRALKAKDIAKIINHLELYKRRDGLDVPAEQILARVKNYPNRFTRSNGKIDLHFSKRLDAPYESALDVLNEPISTYKTKGDFNAIKFLNLVLTALLISKKSENLSTGKDFERVIKDALTRNTDSIGFLELEGIKLPLAKFLLKAEECQSKADLIRRIVDFFIDGSRTGHIIIPHYINSVISHTFDFEDKLSEVSFYQNTINTSYLELVDDYSSKVIQPIPIRKWSNIEVGKINDLIYKNLDSERDFELHEKLEFNKTAILFPPLNVKDSKSSWSTDFDFINELDLNSDIVSYHSAVVLLSESSLYSTERKKVKAREFLISNGFVKSIVTLPFNSNAAKFNACLIYLDLSKQRKNVHLINYKNVEDIDSNFGWKELSDLINDRDEVNEISVLVENEEIAINQFDLSPSRYLKSRINYEIRENHRVYRLSDLIISSTRGKNTSREHLVEGGTYKFINTKRLDFEGVYLKNDNLDIGLNEFSDEEFDLDIIEKGLIVSLIGDHLKPNILLEDTVSCILDKNLVCLEVDDSVILQDYLAYELKEEYVTKQLSLLRKGITAQYIKLDDLLNIEIQVPSFNEQANLILSRQGELLKDVFQFDKIKGEAKDYIATLKHTLKQELKILSSDFNSLTRFLVKKTDNKESIDSDEIIVPRIEGESREALKPYELMNVIKRLDTAIENSHQILDKAQDALELDKTQKEKLNLKKLVKDIIEPYHEIEFDLDLMDITLLADKVQLKMMITNFIENAKKHGFRESNLPWKMSFTIKEDKEHDTVNLWIGNNGKPISKEFSLEEFISKKGSFGKRQGTGFGGYLIHKIVSNHNGEVGLIDATSIPTTDDNVIFTVSLSKR